MSYYEPPPNNPNPFAPPPVTPGGGRASGAGMAGHQPPPMPQQPSMTIAPSQPMMMIGVQPPSMMLMAGGMTPPTRHQDKIRCFGICDIVCSALLIVLLVSMVLGGLVEAKQLIKTMGKTSYYIILVLCVIGVVCYSIDIFFAWGLLPAGNPMIPVLDSISKATRWIWSQVGCIVFEVITIGYNLSTVDHAVGYATVLFWLVTLCRGGAIYIVFQFKRDLQAVGGIGNAVGPSMITGGAQEIFIDQH